MMSKLRFAAAAVRSLFGRRIESELDQEIRFHVDELTADNLRAGMSPDEARRQALIAIGGIEQTKENCRDAFGARFVEEFIRDAGFGFRQMRRSPGFAAVIVLTLALGIGANTAVFSALDAVLLRPLPFPDQDRLVLIYGFAMTTANVEQWQEAAHSYDEFGAVAPEAALWTGGEEPERLATASVSTQFFPLLGLHPAAGRWFGPDDYRADSGATAIVGESFRRDKFGGGPDIVGRRVTLDGRIRTIIGVMPAHVPLPFPEPDFWLPLRSGGRTHGAYALARLKPGVDVRTARTEALALSERLAPAGRIPKGHVPIQVHTLLDMLVGDVRTMLIALAAAVGFVYLIACTNVANLMLARATARNREISIRLALGAGRGRLFRQLSTEALLPAGLGAASGLLASKWLLKIVVLLLPYRVSRIEEAAVNVPVLFFAALLAVLAALAFGLAPLLQAGRCSLQETLRETTHGITDTRRRRILRGALVVGEVSIALVLVIGAGLLIKTFLRLRPSDPGFNPRDKLVLNIRFSGDRYRGEAERLAFVASAMDRLRALPEVRGVGAASDLPFSGSAWPADIVIDGRKVAGNDTGILALCRVITPGFLGMMETPLTAGREFDDDDDARRPGVAVVNQSFARRFLPGDEHEALGRRMTVDIGGLRYKEFTVVGIARDARIFANSSAARPELYLPLAQAGSARLSIVVDVPDPLKKAALAKQILREDDPQLLIDGVESMEDMLYTSVAYERFHALLLGSLAALAFLLALIGTYGVLSYTAGLRVREMGIRLALGARRRQVVWIVLKQGFVLTGCGILLGAAGAWAVTRYLASLLAEVTPTDATTFLASMTVWVLVAVLACLVPAVRAARVDPSRTLRTE